MASLADRYKAGEYKDQQLALEMINGIDDAKVKKKIEKSLATAKPRVPRPFF